MKMTKMLLLSAVAAAALTANQNNLAADFSPSDLANRAVAASPRALEQFPWLARQVSTPTESTPRGESVLSTIKKNRALAASPRMIEQYPELARIGQQSTVATAKCCAEESQFAGVIRNRALAASPRMLEEFPQLARGYTAQLTCPSCKTASVLAAEPGTK
jgi:hypothetical protein